MSKQIAVVISDIHFSIGTLKLATTALRNALSEARALELPLIIAGDLSDTKAVIRAEVANSIIDLLQQYKDVEIVILPGNHDLINQHGIEHSLNFLKPYAKVIDEPREYLISTDPELWVGLIPYQPTVQQFKSAVKRVNCTFIIAHQGIQTASMGAYFKDESSVSPEELPGLTVISGHYHMKQDIQLPENGVWRYLGSPYSVTFAEAKDGPKGFNILNSDGTLEQIRTSLRKHVILELTVAELEAVTNGLVNDNPYNIASDDLLWVKVTGSYEELSKLDKREIGLAFIGHSNFKLDKYYIGALATRHGIENLTYSEIFDSIIDSTEETEVFKKELKGLWKELV